MDQISETEKTKLAWQKELKDAIHVLRATNYISRYPSLEDSGFIFFAVWMISALEYIASILLVTGMIGIWVLLALVYQARLRYLVSSSGIDQQLIDGKLDIRQIEDYVPLVERSVEKDESSTSSLLSINLKLLSANLAWYTIPPKKHQFSIWQLFGRGRTWWMFVLFALALIGIFLIGRFYDPVPDFGKIAIAITFFLIFSLISFKGTRIKLAASVLFAKVGKLMNEDYFSSRAQRDFAALSYDQKLVTHHKDFYWNLVVGIWLLPTFAAFMFGGIGIGSGLTPGVSLVAIAGVCACQAVSIWLYGQHRSKIRFYLKDNNIAQKYLLRDLSGKAAKPKYLWAVKSSSLLGDDDPRSSTKIMALARELSMLKTKDVLPEILRSIALTLGAANIVIWGLYFIFRYHILFYEGFMDLPVYVVSIVVSLLALAQWLIVPAMIRTDEVLKYFVNVTSE